MNEQDARKYIKGLILSGKKELRDKALARFKARFGHSFWETKRPRVKTAEELAKEVGLI